MVTSSYPRRSGDPRGVFVENSAKSLRTHAGVRVSVLVPDDYEGVQAGQDMTVFSYAPRPWQRLAYGAGMLQNVRKYPWLALFIPVFIFCQARAIRRAVQKSDIDIIHAHWWFPQAFATILGLLGLRSRPPVVCTLHGSDVFRLTSWGWKALRAWVVARCRVMIVATEQLRQVVESDKIGSCLVSVIPPAIPLEKFSYQPKKHHVANPTLLYVGRLTKPKGIWELLEAFHDLSLDVPGAEAVLVGDGEDRSAVEFWIQQHDLARRIHLVGPVANDTLQTYYHQADVLLLPSHTEGLGMVLVEAMACGTLVVASNVGGIPSLVNDRQTGFLCQPHNAKSLAEALQACLHLTEAERAQIQQAARLRVERGLYNDQRHAEALREVYSGLLSNHSMSEPL